MSKKICPVCEDPVPAPRGYVAGGDGSHRSCLVKGFRQGLFRTVADWEKMSEKFAKELDGESETLEEGEIDERWRKSTVKRTTLPPGKYYIGDLCYAMIKEDYDKIWGDTFGYDEGLFTNGTKTFMVRHTAHGDGSYKGSNGYEYPVDAGIIGICNAAMLQPDLLGPKPQVAGSIFVFTKPVEVNMTENGVFRFDSRPFSLSINTTGWDEEEDEY